MNGMIVIVINRSKEVGWKIWLFGNNDKLGFTHVEFEVIARHSSRNVEEW